MYNATTSVILTYVNVQHKYLNGLGVQKDLRTLNIVVEHFRPKQPVTRKLP